MAIIAATMQAIGNEPQTCYRRFERGESMTAIEYDNGEPTGWHTDECVKFWKQNGCPKCGQNED